MLRTSQASDSGVRSGSHTTQVPTCSAFVTAAAAASAGNGAAVCTVSGSSRLA